MFFKDLQTDFQDYYIAIIGDIKDSRTYPDREKIQETLNRVLDQINHQYGQEIAANFVITLGDEFQGLLTSGANLMEVITKIKQAMAPVRIRLGIGLGQMKTKIIKAQALGADGPAYYCARQAIEDIKADEKTSKSQARDCLISLQNSLGESQVGQVNTDVILLNQILSLMYVVEKSWTGRQRQIILDMILSRKTQSQLAQDYDVKQPSISKALDTGNYYSYQAAYDLVKLAFSEVNHGN